MTFLGSVFSHNYNRLESGNRWEIVQVPSSLTLLIYSPRSSSPLRSSTVRYEHQRAWHSRIPENDFVSSIVTYFNQSSLSYLESCLAYIDRHQILLSSRSSRVFDFIKISRLFSFFFFCFLSSYLEILYRGRSIIKSIIIRDKKETSKSKHHKTWSRRFERDINVDSQEDICYSF